MIDKRYQVFVSSTYKDLIEERQHVSEQLLRSRCIPSGMELFTASGRPPWAVIKSALDTTDYMILILAGRYGSVDSEGISFTEREYDYAISLDIPVLVFLHEKPDRLPYEDVDTGELREKLGAFRKKVSDSERHTVQFWRDANDLAQKVSNAINEAMRSEPRPGWIRVGTETDLEGDKRPAVTPRAMSTSDDLREALAATGGAAQVERAISDAVRSVKSLPFVQGKADVDVVNVRGEYRGRLSALEETARPLVKAVAGAARWGSSELDWHLVELVMELSRAPRRSGSKDLIDLMRAPASLVFTAAGVGASAGGRDDLLALLLSDAVEVEDPYRNHDTPAVGVLTADLMYTDGWPAKRLREYLESALNDDAWRGSVLDCSWERWQYLVGVASDYYSQTLGVSRGERLPVPSD